MQTVYRFEGLDGYGVYRSEELNQRGFRLQEKVCKKHSDFKNNRPGMRDFYEFQKTEIYKHDEFYFACPDVQSLKKWFEGFYDDFTRNRTIVLKKFETEKVWIGQSKLQCIFVPNGSGEVINPKELDN